MLKSRIIPIVLWDGNQAVQTTRFGERRRIGSIVQVIKMFEMRNVDELIILDIEASRMERQTDLVAMKIFASELSMPLTIGGGITKPETGEELIRTCCDKLVIRRGLRNFRGESILRVLSNKFGSQACVVACDVLAGKVLRTHHRALGTSSLDGFDPIKFCEKIVAQGAGEILLTSVDQQGTMNGYNLRLIEKIAAAVAVPIVANGGCGSVRHMADALKAGASAVAASTVFAFTHLTPRAAAEGLAEMGFNVRIGA